MCISGFVDTIDWVELIPYDETRNYIQRVIESVAVYRYLSGDEVPSRTLALLLRRGSRVPPS